MPDVKNLFVESEEAKRYNTFRPVYHHLLAEQLNLYFKKRINKTLDVACGTGHSTIALAKISDSIIGCDLSNAMLDEAQKNSNLKFIQSPAENLPFPDLTFDYINISMAYQWLDQTRFLKEVKRVLNPSGTLGIDNYGFTGKMIGHEQFTEKYKAFDEKYMKPALRNKDYPDDSELQDAGLTNVAVMKYDHEVLMSKTQFINYLMTRSNFLQLPIDRRLKVETDLINFYEDIFNNENKKLSFRGAVRLYQVHLA